MKIEKIVSETTNRGEYNRAYKRELESKRKIHCSYCGYHRGENKTSGTYYGGFKEPVRNYEKTKYPSWKLVSRNKKQWEDKSLKITVEETRYSNREYIDITW